MGIPEGDGHGPGDLGVGGDVLVALPGDVVGGIADAEDRIQQQLHRPAARADDQVGARQVLAKLARASVRSRSTPTSRVTLSAIESHRQQRREAAIPQALQGQGQDRHQAALPVSAGLSAPSG
jgi:hypothetical protein